MPEAKTSLRRSSDELVALQRRLRILRSLRWAPQVRQRFLAEKARRLPRVEYPPLEFDPRAFGRALAQVRRRLVGRNPVEELLRRKCDEVALVAQLLASRGTRQFYECSVRLYGHPRDDELQTARRWAGGPPARPEGPLLDSREAAALVRSIVEPHLGPACRVRESARITADAAAGPRTIALRQGARFSPRQARGLAHHEGLWHVLTGLNGRRQPVLSVLGVGLPLHTESQEGGGVVSELLAGCVGDQRRAELAARALAVDLAARGADFLQVFDFLRERLEPARAALIAERVFRGGVLSGGAPFTKDAVYLRGARRILRFLDRALDEPQPGLLLAFAAGKMRVEDAPLVEELIREGICAPPAFVPEWMLDRDALRARLVALDVRGEERPARLEPRGATARARRAARPRRDERGPARATCRRSGSS